MFYMAFDETPTYMWNKLNNAGFQFWESLILFLGEHILPFKLTKSNKVWLK